MPARSTGTLASAGATALNLLAVDDYGFPFRISDWKCGVTFEDVHKLVAAVLTRVSGLIVGGSYHGEQIYPT